jgi:hypothetical protein
VPKISLSLSILTRNTDKTEKCTVSETRGQQSVKSNWLHKMQYKFAVLQIELVSEALIFNRLASGIRKLINCFYARTPVHGRLRL